MPRFSNEGPAVSEWCDREGEGSSTRDLCNICADKIVSTPWPAEATEPGEPCGVHCPGDVEHPPYREGEYQASQVWWGYDCDQCGRPLGPADD